jgi:hypothetical protein
VAGSPSGLAIWQNEAKRRRNFWLWEHRRDDFGNPGF